MDAAARFKSRERILQRRASAKLQKTQGGFGDPVTRRMIGGYSGK
jgi:hypothetical protein